LNYADSSNFYAHAIKSTAILNGLQRNPVISDTLSFYVCILGLLV